MLGNLNYVRKDYDKAIPYFEKCIALKAESAGSYNLLAAIYIIKDDLARAEACLTKASEINPALANIRYNRAQIAEKRGDNRAAEDQYLKEIETSPKHFKALYNLSRLYRAEGDEAKEYDALKRCLDIDAAFPLTYFYLARIHLNRGEKYREAIDLVRKGLELKPEKSELPLGYFLLADLYNRVGDDARSREFAQKGQALSAGIQSKK
jgi:tetratricopeptide (TPR) repeat protein